MSDLANHARVLVVDDEKFIRDILADFLSMEGYAVRVAEDGAQALREVSNSTFDLVITDLKMPKLGGIDLLSQMGEADPSLVTVIMTGFGTVETAIDAMKRGAYDYILKPFKVDEVLHVVRRGLEKKRLSAENIRLREALSLYKVSEAIRASLSLDEVIATVTDSALHDIPADAVGTWLLDGAGGYVRRLHSARDNFASETMELSTTELENRLKKGPLLEHGPELARFFAVAPVNPPESLLAIALTMKDSLLGWVSAVSFTPRKRFDEGHRKLLSIIAARAAVAIENAKLYEDLQATFKQTIQGLAKAIDKMDRYTAGHSERVALYATHLARRIGLGEREVEIVYQSALMHDIGKIGCVMNLNKPGKLSQDEYEAFKKHPVFGRDILEPIKFLHPLIPGVHLHHERWDGRGYPLGLRGEQVPLMARIISVADTYDAMTSDRAYRQALPHEVAVGEIERCSGTQFDPAVANMFIRWLDDLREELVAEGVRIPE